MKNSKQTDYFNDILEDKAVVVNPGEGESLSLDGSSVVFKVTSDISNNQLGVYQITLQPKTVGAGLHYHRFMDETFIVNKGILTIQKQDKKINVFEGGVVYVPRYTPHGFSNDSDEVVVLTLVFNPSQEREGFFRGLLEIMSAKAFDKGKFEKLYSKYDSYPVENKE
jgi:quercetin dioxygenase-like cupin family protein